MVKYSFEFKLKIVQEYLQGKGEMGYLSKKHGITPQVECSIGLIVTKNLVKRALFESDKIKVILFNSRWMRTFRSKGSDGLSKTKESIEQIIDSLRGPFKLVELLETLKFPKSTFMY